MSLKIETRGKWPGVKIHLDPEECQALMGVTETDMGYQPGVNNPSVQVAFSLSKKMGKKIKELLAAEPDLLGERTPEQVAAILAKEVEKASLQLSQLKAGSSWQKVDPVKLQDALNKHVPHK